MTVRVWTLHRKKPPALLLNHFNIIRHSFICTHYICSRSTHAPKSIGKEPITDDCRWSTISVELETFMCLSYLCLLLLVVFQSLLPARASEQGNVIGSVRIYITEKPFTSKWKKGDVGMAKHFSKKYGNKGWAFDYPVSAIWNKFLFCQDACQCLMLHPYITASRTIINIVLHWTLTGL